MSLISLLGLGLSALGGRGGKQKAAQSQSVSGWQALPKEVQEVYLRQFLPGVTSEFSSEVPAPVSEVYKQYAAGLPGLRETIPDYMSFFQQNITDPTLQRIQEEADIQKNNLNALAARSGLGGLFNSNLGVQLAQLQKNADDRKASLTFQSNKENLLNALGLRDQIFGEMQRSGDQNYDKLTRLAGLLGAFPGGSTQTSLGPSVAGPNAFDRIGGALTALGGLSSSGALSGLGGLFS